MKFTSDAVSASRNEEKMNFREIAENRYSCRSYDTSRAVEQEKIHAILNSARLSPSACNGQPYHITVCRGDSVKKIARAVQGVGINKFADQAPIMIVISEKPYVKTAALGAKLKKNDYRSIDIGILSAYITAEAAAQDLGTCIMGWLDSDEIKKICNIDGTVRLVISLGYPAPDISIRDKKRKPLDELLSYVD